MPTSNQPASGLEGVIAGETAVSSLAGGLDYRGYAVADLCGKTSFEEVAFLLLHGELPTAAVLAAFKGRLVEARALPPFVQKLLHDTPAAAPPMDVLRTCVSLLAAFDPDMADNSKPANQRKAERLLGQVPLVIAGRQRALRNLSALSPRPDLGHAAHLLYLLTGQAPKALDARAFEISLILYADHEFNASTFTARVVCSTQADLHSGVVAALSALKGPLHGGANEKVLEQLLATGGPAQAEGWVRAALARKSRIMGFGHRVLKTDDVRASILRDLAQQAAQRAGTQVWEETAAIIEGVLASEKKLRPNVDWPAARLYHYLGLPGELYPALFAAARVAGWSAHIIEQREQNRLIQPRARYVGREERKVVPLEQR